MNRLKIRLGAALAVLLMAASVALHAQGTGSVHGKVTNPAGMPLTTGQVKLSTDRAADPKDRKFPYSFDIDGTGSYKGSGINPGTYVAIVFQGDKSIDFIDQVVIAAGDDKVVDFDMTRKEFIDKMTPEEKKQIEDFKKKNAGVTAENAKIANLNQTLVQARADIKAGNFDAAVSSMQAATAAKPDEMILWLELANAQLGQADAAAANDRKSGKSPTTDTDVTSKYDASVTSFQKAIDLNNASKKPNPQATASAYNNLGRAMANSGKPKDAATAYEAAVKADPAQAGMYYYNEAATLYNAQQLPDAVSAADKAIAADPNRAMAYYIKGQALIPGATVDAKTQKIVAPPGCVEAYNKYLELDPTGAHAEEVKGILTGIGAQISTKYKATPAKK